jgi:hypothetical protein
MAPRQATILPMAKCKLTETEIVLKELSCRQAKLSIPHTTVMFYGD